MSTASQLSENSHQGFDGLKAALCLGSMEAKSNTASGMPLRLRQNSIGSRSTGKERDTETGLDFFEARYYSGAQGRFTSADLPFADQTEDDPQSWNLYAYARNNPLNSIDPTGRFKINCEVVKCGPVEPTGPGGIPLDFYLDWLKRQAAEQLEEAKIAFDEERLRHRAEDNLRQGNYLAYGIDQAGLFLVPKDGVDVALVMVPVGKYGQVSGKLLSKPVQRLLKGIEHLADKQIREAILSRGGVGSTVRKVGHYAEKTVLEAAEDLARDKSNMQAREALKLVQQAARKAQTYGSSK
jgi:RHS repeat-associated protein